MKTPKKPFLVLVKTSSIERVKPHLNPSCRWKNKDTKLTKELRENRPSAIDYATCKLEPIEYAKEFFGERLRMFYGSYYLDGTRILIGDLIRISRE